MRAIYKYPLREGNQPIVAPCNWLPHHVGEQIGRPTLYGSRRKSLALWAEVNTENPPKEYSVTVYGTGFQIAPSETYVGTVQDSEGFVWHVYTGKE